MITKNSIIETCAKFSDDNTQRYFLKKTWYTEDEYINKESFIERKAIFIMMNPSKDNGKKSDQTITNISNFILDNGYNSLTILNLFSYMATDFKNVPYSNKKRDILNEYIIKNSCKNSNFIVLACGTSTDRVKLSKRKKILKLLKSNKSNIFCFADNNNYCYHPRVIKNSWKLINYPFNI